MSQLNRKTSNGNDADYGTSSRHRRVYWTFVADRKAVICHHSGVECTRQPRPTLGDVSVVVKSGGFTLITMGKQNSKTQSE